MPEHRGSLFRAIVFAAAAAATTAAGCSPHNGGGSRTIRPPTTEVEVLREIQLTEQARLPEQDANLVDVEVGEDYLVFIYNRDVTTVPIEVGNVVSGILHGGYLRRVVAVSQESPTRIRAMTEHAELGELIGDGHFRVVFHPGDGTGEYALPDEDLGVAIEELSSGWSVFGNSADGRFSCGSGAGGSVTITPRFDIDLGMEVDVDIRWSTRWGIPPVRGELEYAIFAVSGAVEAGLSVNTTRNVSSTCSYNIIEEIRRRTGRRLKREWTTTFTVGPVPVVLTHTIEPEAQVSIGVQIETGNTTAAASGRVRARVGTEYTRRTGWRTIWEPSRSAGASLTTAQPGTLSIMGQFQAGVGYSCRVYDAAGPGFSFGPQVTATFTSPPPYCDWTVDVKGALNVTGRVDLQIPVIDYKLAEYSISQSLGESTWYMRTGMFPWCRDAGMRDGGSPTMRDGGGTPRDGGSSGSGDGGGGAPRDGGGSGSGDGGSSDPCASAGSTCQTCNMRAGCGFCMATGRCVSDSRRSECPAAAWQDSPSECEVCDGYTDCRSCTGDAFCGWCYSTGTCMTANSGGGPPVPCPDWNYGDIFACR